MNHELVMLRGALRMKKCAKEINKTIKKLAVHSFSTQNWRDGTMGQVQAICAYTEQRDKCWGFYDGVCKALKSTPRGYRALICEVYLYNTDKLSICQKYGVSLSTLYRYLAKARKTFKDQLDFLGLSEGWLQSNFGNVTWVSQMLSHGGRGRPSL